MSFIGFTAKFNFLLFYYISVLKYCSSRLLQNCKSYQLKSKFCSSFLGIVKCSPYKTEFGNLGLVVWVGYVISLFFEEIFW